MHLRAVLAACSGIWSSTIQFPKSLLAVATFQSCLVLAARLLMLLSSRSQVSIDTVLVLYETASLYEALVVEFIATLWRLVLPVSYLIAVSDAYEFGSRE